jgi:hypothetical protein
MLGTANVRTRLRRTSAPTVEPSLVAHGSMPASPQQDEDGAHEAEHGSARADGDRQRACAEEPRGDGERPERCGDDDPGQGDDPEAATGHAAGGEAEEGPGPTTGSSIWPRRHSRRPLKPRWTRPPWRKALVMRRHHSPSPTNAGTSPKVRASTAPVVPSARPRRWRARGARRRRRGDRIARAGERVARNARSRRTDADRGIDEVVPAHRTLAPVADGQCRATGMAGALAAVGSMSRT